MSLASPLVSEGHPSPISFIPPQQTAREQKNEQLQLILRKSETR